MKTKRIFISVSLIITLITSGMGQDEIPRDFVSPQELVTLSSNLDLSTALELLSEYSIQFLNKPIYDPQKRSGPIGIDVRGMPWKKALGLILSRRGLWYVEKERFFEIVSASKTESSLLNESTIELGTGVKIKPNSREIKIETIFFEGNRKQLTEIGLDWSTFYRGKVAIDANQVGALNLSDNFFQLSTRIPKNLIGVDVEALLQAFDSKKLGKVLAQPQVVVTEGNEGIIQVGQDFSIKTRDFAGNVIDRFYSTGTILKVTPFLIESDDEEKKEPVIFLQVHVERSTAHPDVVSTIIQKSQANSYIQLFNGEETIIAGLYSTEKNDLRKGVPILKDFPWWFLGFPYIFGYNHMEEVEKELVIIIKASLLDQVAMRQKNNRVETLNLKQSLVDNYDQLFDGNPLSPTILNQTIPTIRQEPQMAENPTAKNKLAYNISNPARSKPSNAAPYQPNPNVHVGKVKHLKDNLILIAWQHNGVADNFIGKQIPIVRNKNNNIKLIGKARMLKNRGFHSVAKLVNTNRKNIQVGDLLVIKN